MTRIQGNVSSRTLPSLLVLYVCVIGCGEGPSPPAGKVNAVAIPANRGSIARRESWQAADFFSDDKTLSLAEAISSSNTDRLRDLLAKQPDLNRPGKYGFTLLFWAFAEENMDAFRLLLKKGADPDQKLAEYCPAKNWNVFLENQCVIFVSVAAARQEFGMEALTYSKNPNQPSAGGVNILHFYFSTLAPYHGSEKHLQTMIDLGVEINTKGAFGYTPCHWAVYESPNLCLPLLKAGADPSIRDDQGKDIVDAVEQELTLRTRANLPISELAPTIEWLNENYRHVNAPNDSPEP